MLIEVFDVNGLSAPAVGVTVLHVGENIYPPVIEIGRKGNEPRLRERTLTAIVVSLYADQETRFVEGSNDSISVTQRSLRVSDADHEL